MNEDDEESKDRLVEQIKKYRRALDKAAEHALAQNEEIAYLTALADVIATLLAAIPMKANYSGDAVKRAKEENISHEEAFNRIYLDMLNKRIKEAQEERVTSSNLLLGIVELLKGMGKDIQLSKEVLDKLEQYAGPRKVRTDASNTPEDDINTTKGLNEALEAISKAINSSRSTDGKQTD